MSKKARDVMTAECKCVSERTPCSMPRSDSRSWTWGAVPICGEDDLLKGMLTDRDIVVKVLAQGKDPAEVKVGEFAQGKPVTIGADDSIEEALDVMAEHKVRRLPVIDGHDCVGVISQADVATGLPDEKVGDLVAAISAAALSPAETQRKEEDEMAELTTLEEKLAEVTGLAKAAQEATQKVEGLLEDDELASRAATDARGGRGDGTALHQGG